MNKVLVAYFSATGVTADKAKAIAEAANGDLYEIRPAVPYTKEDLDFKNKQSRSSVEMSDLGSRPEIADKNANVEAYDTVFLGFPIWWYMAPTIVNTFLESYDFSGKTVILLQLPTEADSVRRSRTSRQAFPKAPSSKKEGSSQKSSPLLSHHG